MELAIRAPRREGSGRRLVYLDVLRGIAILLVLGYHQVIEAHPWHWGSTLLTRWGVVGWTGVELFFVLSGFLIGGLLLEESARFGGIRLGRFYVRRAFKIWPAYLVFIGTVAVYLLVFHRHSAALGTHGASDVARLVWPYLLQIQNYDAPLRQVIVHPWSLAVEEHFYLVLPLLMLVLVWKKWLGALPWICLAVAMGCLTWRTANYFRLSDFGLQDYYFPTHLRIDSLMMGVLLAYVVRFRPEWVEGLRRRRMALLAASLVCFVPAVLWERDEIAYLPTAGLSVLAVGSMGLVLAAWFADRDRMALDNPASQERLAPRWARGLAWVGFYSYSIYLWHLPFQALVIRKVSTHLGVEEQPWLPLVVMAAYVPLTIAIGAVMSRLVEWPAIAWRDRLFPAQAGIGAERSRVASAGPNGVVTPTREMPEAGSAAA